MAEVRKLLDAEQPVAPNLPARESIAPEDDAELEEERSTKLAAGVLTGEVAAAVLGAASTTENRGGSVSSL